MKIVIDIDENLYTRLFDNGEDALPDANEDCIAILSNMSEACIAIRNGIPLPKGHGRLIDVDSFNDYVMAHDLSFQKLLQELPTVVEADNGE